MSNEAFFAGVRKVVGKLDQTQVDSINGIMAEAQARGVTDPDMLGYLLSTGWHEAKLRPVREGFKKTDASARAYVKRHYGNKYGKPAGPYGHWYYGRGLVQLTWHSNYKKVGQRIGVDLEQFPDKAMEPDTAAAVLVNGMLQGWFNGSGKGLAHYLGNGRKDWKNARRTVNITDKWQRFRDTAIAFSKVIKAHPWKIERKAAVKPAPEAPQKPVQTNDGAKAAGGAAVGILGGLAAFWHNGGFVLLSAIGIVAAGYFGIRMIKNRSK